MSFMITEVATTDPKGLSLKFITKILKKYDRETFSRIKYNRYIKKGKDVYYIYNIVIERNVHRYEKGYVKNKYKYII